MLRAWNCSALIFLSFANINEIEVFLRLLHSFQRWYVNFLNFFFSFVHNLLEFRQRHNKFLRQAIDCKQEKTKLANFPVLVQNVCMPATSRSQELGILYTHQQIAQRVKELGAQITADFAGQRVVLIGVLKGATIFLADLARSIDLDTTFDFI